MENSFNSSYTIKGRITNTQGQPVQGIIVRAYGKDSDIHANTLGKEAITDKEGFYSIEYTEQDLRVDDKPISKKNVIIHAFRGNSLVAKSSVKRSRNLVEVIDLTISTDSPRESGIKISGFVLNEFKEPIANKQVMVFDVDLRGAGIYHTVESLEKIKENGGFEIIGETNSNSKGYYEIVFDSATAQRSEHGLPDIIAYALDREEIVGRSKLIIHNNDKPNPELERLNIQLIKSPQRGTSEYEEIMTAILPFLKEGKLNMYELTEQQGEFLAIETNKHSFSIKLLIQADKLRHEYPRQRLSHEILYGLGRQNVPLNWTAISTRKEDELAGAIQRSMRQNIISAQEAIKEFLQKLQALSVKAGFETSSDPEDIAVGKMLDISLADDILKTSFINAYRNFEGTSEQFWKEYLPHQAEFREKPELISALQLTSQLHIISGNHLPLIQELQVNRKIKNVKALVGLSKQEWAEIVKQIKVPPEITGSSEEERISLYIENIQNLLQAAYPTEKISMMIKNKEFDHHDENMHHSLNAFFEKAENFDISTSRVEDFTNIIKEVAPERESPLKEYLQTVQRIYQVSPTSEAMSKLWDNDLDSAFKIASYPEQIFLESYSESLGGIEIAKTVYERAFYQAMRAQNTALTLQEIIYNGSPAFTTFAPQQYQLLSVIQQHIPNWEELFGRADVCETKHCQSVYGPAAYLVDIMRFLAMGKKNGQNKTPLDKLLNRRPDLSHIPLTCENTNTIIPYIDLVNEVLEYYVAYGKLDAGTAHDTAKATAAELRAQPQYTMKEAYKKLKDTVYPFDLPYHQPLDVIRTYLNFIQTSRYEIMEVFGSGASMPAQAEYLGISEEEYKILVGKDFNEVPTTKNIWEYYGYINQNQLKNNIYKVPEFITRTGVKYVDLVKLVKTKFINPDQEMLNYVESIFKGSSLNSNSLYTKLKQIKEGGLLPENDADIKQALDAKGIPYPIFKDRITLDFENLQGVITLYEPQSKCELETTVLRSVKSIYESLPDFGLTDDFLSRMHRFIRLWRKTGWTIHELDNFIKASGEGDINKALIEQLTWIKKINTLIMMPLVQLTSLWGSIDCYGEKSLYAKLFLNKALQKIDEAFLPDAFGRYLQDNTILIKDHLPALLSAVKLSNETLKAIVADAQVDIATAPLTIENLSVIYRYAVLAKALKLHPTELIILKKIFDGNPFSKWNDALKKYEEIDPEKTFEFIEIVQKVKSAGFKASTLHYIINNVIDPTTNLAIKDEKILQAVIAIRNGLLKIDQDHPEKLNDPVTEELLRNKISLVFSQDLTEQLLATLNGHITYSTPTDKNLGVVIPDGLKDKISYLKAKGILQSIGVLTDTERASLEGLTGANAAFKDAVKRIYGKPEQLIRENFGVVFAYKETNPAVAENKIKEVIKILLGHPAQPSPLSLAQKLEKVYESLLPYLKEQLKKRLITQTIAPVLGLDEATTQVLLQNQYEHIIQGISSSGLSAQYYKDLAFTQLEKERTDKEINFSWDINSPEAPIPADQFSVRWEGWISPASTTEYTIIGEVQEADESLKVWLDDQILFEKAAADPNLSWEGAITLTAGKLHKIKVEYTEDVQKAGIKLLWKTDSQAKEIIPDEFCYPASEVENFSQLLEKYHRATLFINGFKLTANEIGHFIKYNANFDNIGFTALTSVHWKRINEYANSLKKEIPQSITSLIDLFEEANKTNPVSTKDHLLEEIVNTTGWNKEQITTLCDAAYLNLNVADFKNEVALIKLQKAVKLAKKTGLSVEALFDWAKSETDFDKLEEIAQSVKNTVKAKYDDEDWLDAAKGLSDKIRIHQQQALIPHLLVRPALKNWGVKDADGLFEHFLIDVQMDACMDTSRIKQAISSVQLFVARCLLNLESELNGTQEIGVSPDAIDSKRWEWMKNYRVWEANRKVFLYPENWLDPELRDDKSPFFKELESELLQNDITDFSVESAFRNYLDKLNEVSNLELCGMYQDQETKTLHIFGRTHAAPYQYYYRTFNTQHKSWTAWDKVQLDIRSVDDKENKGVHLIPVVWKKRLFLFWPEFKEQYEENKTNSGKSIEELSKKTPSSLKQYSYWTVKFGYSEYRDGRWSPKQLTKEDFIPGFNIEGQYAKFSGEPSTMTIHGRINAKNELEIHFFLNGWGKFGSVSFADIQSEMQISIPNYNLETKDSSYESYFMSYEKTGKLNFNNLDYLKKNQYHRILYSHQFSDFDKTLHYPFFYYDPYRSYFALPEIFISSIEVVKNPDKALYIPLEKVKDKYYVEKEPYKPRPIGPDDYMPNLDGNILINNSHSFDYNIFNTANGRIRPNEVTGFRHSLKFDDNLVSEAGPSAYILSFKKSTAPTALQLKSKDKYMQNVTVLEKAFGGISVADNWQQWFKTYTGLKFYTFFHPYASNFISLLNQGGVDGLLEADTSLANDNGSFFDTVYDPNETKNYVVKPLPKINVDFGELKDGMFEMGSYSLYNWEVFFHAPLFIATRLSKNGKYAEAMKWFHYIFDPTTNEKPSSTNPNARYWKVLPFKTLPTDSVEDFLKGLKPNLDPNKENKKIGEWRDNPFRPHLIARGRPLAYMKNVIVRYIENLIAWGDDLFRRDTIETINEATQLYVIAAHILGPRPQFVPMRGEIKAETFDSLKAKLDDFSNAVVQLENIFPFSSEIPASTTTFNGSLLGIGNTLYFSIPHNDKILLYWDTVADRLFKIRHCMNIEGVERNVALFEPPIDPSLLIQATAKGISIGNILSDLSAPAPVYRFSYLLEKANEFCSEVKNLGNALLSALEKRDSEELNRLRTQHEETLLNKTTAIRERQVLEARANKQSLEKNRETSQKRLQHYLDLMGITEFTVPDAPQIPATLTADTELPADTVIQDITPDVDVALVDSDEAGVKLIGKEKEELDKSKDAIWWQGGATAGESLAGLLHLIPDFGLYGTPLGVGGKTRFGGSQLGSATSALAKIPQIIGAVNTFQSGQALKMGTYIRREQDWALQANLTAREIVQLDKQITAADIRIQMAEKELNAHLRQVENNKEINLFLRGESVGGYIKKFSTTELYQWMKEQLFFIYKQSYQLVYDMARKAEKAYQFELGQPEASFIQYGYWDSTYEGLVAGDKLQLALRQMEKSFIEQNVRGFELTKHISLALLNPRALLDLKNTGSCEINLPEELFDLDYPGHYFRTIKSISITVPCVVGPYTTVNCTLRLLKNEIRTNTSLNEEGKYERNNEDGISIDDDRFVEGKPPVKKMATSAAQLDSGVFELSFRDERYLPFEGAGVISTWKLELNGKYVIDGELKDLSQFDYNSISDIILHINYTSREDAGIFRQEAIKHLEDFMKKTAENAPEPFMRMFSLKYEFPDALYKLIEVGGNPQKADFVIGSKHFPMLLAKKTLKVLKAEIFLIPKDGKTITDPVSLKISNEDASLEGTPGGAWQKLPLIEVKRITLNLTEFEPLQNWTIEAGNNQLKKEEIEDILILFRYAINE